MAVNRRLDKATVDQLIAVATATRLRAHAPYSGFQVGAAALAPGGRVFPGCNVENASYGLTLCAERVAVAHAVAAGETALRAVAVVADAGRLAPPCGACLQVLVEFAGSPDLLIVLANLAGDRQQFTLADLYPHPFRARNLLR